jgi:ketosteroid isomerase-like protein
MRNLTALAIALASTLLLRPAHAQAPAPSSLADQVRAAESAFAATMAGRDFAAFGASVSAEAVFFGRGGPLRGKAAVLEAWRGFFDGAAAPFSWEPETVEVLASGTLALSSGPVRDPDGKRIGTFNSIWRRESDGRWRVVFDKGCPACVCATAP